MARILTYHELEQTVYELEKDLLESRNAEASAFREKEQLECIFNAVPDHIAIIDQQFKIQRANKSLTDNLKCQQEKLIGEFCYKYICRADSPPSACPHAQMLDDGKEHKAKTYNEQWGMQLHVTSSPLYDDEGKLIGGVYVARAIATRKDSDEAFRESQEKGEKI